MRRFLNEEELEGRLNCFGDFDQQDTICLYRCAININCAIAKGRYTSIPLQEDEYFPGGRFMFE